jgi:hypothetical protein
MNHDSLKSARDDVVRDGAAFEAYLQPGSLIDSDHPDIVAYARRVAGEGGDREKALRLYYAVTTRCATISVTTPTTRL